MVSVAVIMSVTVTECGECGCNYKCHCDCCCNMKHVDMKL